VGVTEAALLREGARRPEKLQELLAVPLPLPLLVGVEVTLALWLPLLLTVELALAVMEGLLPTLRLAVGLAVALPLRL